MTQKNLFKTSCMALLMVFVSSTAFAQDKKESKGIDWMKELKERITINGYMHGGYEYNDKGGKTTSTFNFKRAIFWGKARITDRWSWKRSTG